MGPGPGRGTRQRMKNEKVTYSRYTHFATPGLIDSQGVDQSTITAITASLLALLRSMIAG